MNNEQQWTTSKKNRKILRTIFINEQCLLQRALTARLRRAGTGRTRRDSSHSLLRDSSEYLGLSQYVELSLKSVRRA